MFATLVLQLPSLHQGGELVVYNPDKSKTVHDFGKSTKRSQFTIHYAAHYADAEHEILKVKSGYRVALVYSLCWVSGNGVRMLTKSDCVVSMRDALMRAAKNSNLLAILLEHKYTPQSFTENGVCALKGIDNDRYDVLCNANAELPDEDRFEFNIAHARLKVSSYDVSGYEGDNPKYYEWEEDERSSEIRQWYDASGKEMANLNRDCINYDMFSYVIDVKRMRVLGDEELSDESTFGRKDLKESIGGWVGNEGLTKTSLYSKYILVLIPKKSLFEMYLNSSLTFAVRDLRKSFSSLSKKSAMERLRMVVEKMGEEGNGSDGFVVNMLDVFEKAKDLPLFKQFLGNIKCLSDGILSKLAMVLVGFGWQKVESSFAHLISATNEKKLSLSCKFVKVIFIFF